MSLNLRLKHMGINVRDDELEEMLGIFACLFAGESRKTVNGGFGSDWVELMDEAHAKGEKGHIGVGTDDVDEAMAYFRNLGYDFDESTLKYDEHGRKRLIYFDRQFCGFAVHLVRND
ncbi:MAG: hypothetical protein IJJ29_07300 [Solobacterium sp.]|nr:hypothetical protein [Solobacterium sp.]